MGAYAYWEEKKIKIWKVEVLKKEEIIDNEEPSLLNEIIIKSSFKNLPPLSSDSTPIQAVCAPNLAAATNPVATGPPPAVLLAEALILVSSVGYVGIL